MDRAGSDNRKIRQRWLVVCTQIAQLALIIVCVMATRPDLNWKERNRHHRQYEELSAAMRNGHLWLEEVPPDSLQEMENPYDYLARVEQGYFSGDDYLSDTSYYKGHYYVYFGVVPELLLFLPCLLLTGHVLPTWAAVLFCACLYAAGLYFFLYQLCRTYFRNTGNGILLLLDWAMFGATQTLFIAHYASVYTMPLIAGMTCGVFGLSFWLMASGEESMGKMSRRYLLAGSVLTALVIGCRPQMAILVFLAFPIFEKQIRNGGFFRLTKQSALNTLCVIGPWLILGGLFLWYNAVRFEDPLEFGVRYLLTVTDMTRVTPDLGRIPVGIYFHLLQPMRLTPEFPFVRGVNTALPGTEGLYIEPLTGGFFAINLIALPGLLLPLLRSWRNGGIQKKNAWLMGSVSLLCAAVLTLLDILMAGISQRYQADYAFLYMLASLVVILSLYEQCGSGESKEIEENTGVNIRKGIITAVLSALTILCVCLNILITLSEDVYFSVKSLNPEGFEWIQKLFCS